MTDQKKAPTPTVVDVHCLLEEVFEAALEYLRAREPADKDEAGSLLSEPIDDAIAKWIEECEDGAGYERDVLDVPL